MPNLPEFYRFKTPEKSATVKVDDFRRINDDLCGIYVFRDNYGDCLYVGQTMRFRDRLPSHLSTSPFSRLIFTADLYYVNEPLLREIFETIFINELNPRYNRAKSYVKHRAKHDAVLFEIEALEGERLALEEEKSEIIDAVKEVDDEYIDPYEIFTDYDEGLSIILGENLRHVERLPEIEMEIKAISREIKRLYRKVS